MTERSFSEKEKAAGLEWLRREALLGNKRAECMLAEYEKLQKQVKELRIK